MINCQDVYPIKVSLFVQLGGKGEPVKVWEGRQQSLFRKNSKDRTESIRQITERLEELREDAE